MTYEEQLIIFAVQHCIGKSKIEAIDFPFSIIKKSLGNISPEIKKELAIIINQKIYEVLRNTGIFLISNSWEVPIERFRPLDIAYTSFQKFDISEHYQLHDILYITVKYKPNKDKFVYKSFKQKRKDSPDLSKLWTFIDLENWQMLANLLMGSKTYWKSFVHEGVFSFRQVEFEEI